MTPIIIHGPAHSGKSTFATMLAKELQCRTGETGEALIERFLDYHRALGDSFTRVYKSVSAMTRKDKVAFGNLLISRNPHVLIDDAARMARIIVGPRRKSEMDAWMKKHPETVIIEIERDGAGDPDDVYELKGYGRDSCWRTALVKNEELDELKVLAKIMAQEMRE